MNCKAAEAAADDGDEKKTTVGLVVGRFQPFHAGHMDAIAQLIESAGCGGGVVVAIVGGSQTPTRDNPFSGAERAAMAAAALRRLSSQSGVPVRIVVVPGDACADCDADTFVSRVVAAAAAEETETETEASGSGSIGAAIRIDPARTVVAVRSGAALRWPVRCFFVCGDSQSCCCWRRFSVATRVAVCGAGVRALLASGGDEAAVAAAVPAEVATLLRRWNSAGLLSALHGRGRAHRNPVPTADVVVELPLPSSSSSSSSRRRSGVVLVRRRNAPVGWALPGGFVDYGEDVWDAARRELAEETGLRAAQLWLLGVYGCPARDPRSHTQTTVFAARAQDVSGVLAGADDAEAADVFAEDTLPEDIVFDHRAILADFFQAVRPTNSSEDDDADASRGWPFHSRRTWPSDAPL